MNETSIRTNNDEATRPPSTLDPFQTAGGSVSIVDGVRGGYNPNHETNHPMTLNLSGHGQIHLRRRVDSAFHLFRRKKLVRWGVFAVVSFVVGIVALLVSNRAMNDKTTVDPIFAYQERFVNFRTILGNHSEPWTFALPNSPQMKSLQWLVFRDKTLATNPVDDKRLVQRHALMTLFYACNGQNWIGGFATQPPWGDNVAILECGFAGIKCDEMGSVVEVQAGQSRWTGYLPDEIGLLTHLKSLQLHVNELQGTLPASAFSRLSNLEELTIDRNEFVSTIPSEIGLMTKLRELHMGRNQLTGSIPSTIKALDLRVLRVQDNDLTGQALEYLASWPNMERLNIDRTWITGTIPESIGKLTNFHTLFLGPYISGTIPNSLANLTNMKFLKMIGDNGSTLGGTIPANFGDLTKLESIVFNSLNIGGSIPTTIGALSALLELAIIGSNLTGEIPTELGYLSNLQRIAIFEMLSLRGTLPNEIGSLPVLEEIWIYETSLSGTVPTGLCDKDLLYPCGMTCSCCTWPCAGA